MLRICEENSPLISQVRLHPGHNFQFANKCGVHLRARRGKRLQCTWSFKRAIYQHAARSVRGFTARFAALHDEYGCPSFAQGDG